MEKYMQNEYIQIIPADVSLTEQVVDYYKRNRRFLQEFEPIRSEEFFLSSIKIKY